MSAHRYHFRSPTLAQILGGVQFAVPVWLPYTRLVCSQCFRSLKRKAFGRSRREPRVEPVCLECRKNASAEGHPETTR